MLLFSHGSSAATLLIIADNDNSIHKQIITLLSKELSPSSNSLEVLHPTQINRSTLQPARTGLILSLGVASAEAIGSFATTKAPILYALLPEALSARYLKCPQSDCVQRRAVLFLDQPLTRQLDLVKLLFPQRYNLAFLYSQFSSSSAAMLNSLAKKEGFTTHSARINDQNETARKLSELLEQADFLITLPDPLVHNAHSIPQLLLNSYRHRVPVIGFSKTYVIAGAVAAVFSDPSDIAKQLVALIRHFNKTGKLNTGGFYPTHYRVLTNPNVASSLNLQLPPASALLEQLKILENRP